MSKKKGVLFIAVCSLLIVSLLLPVQSLAKSKKLVKKDFVISGIYKKDQANGNLIKYWKKKNIAYSSFNMIDEKKPAKKVVQTKRKVYLNCHKKRVFRLYGHTKMIKVNTKKDRLYWVLKKKMKDKESAKLIKQAKRYCEYTYKKNYKIRFYFNKKNRVTTIAFMKKEERFKFAKWNK